MPLEGGAFRPVSEVQLVVAAARVRPQVAGEEIFREVQRDVLEGRHVEIRGEVQALLDRGVDAQEILQRGLVSTMEVIGNDFKRERSSSPKCCSPPGP